MSAAACDPEELQTPAEGEETFHEEDGVKVLFRDGAYVKPKRALTAYNLFFQCQRRIMLEEKAEKSSPKIGFATMARTVSARWKQVDENEREYYLQLAAKDKIRYLGEMKLWKKLEKQLAKKQKQKQKECKTSSKKAAAAAAAATKDSSSPKKLNEQNQMIAEQDSPLTGIPEVVSVPSIAPSSVSSSTSQALQDQQASVQASALQQLALSLQQVKAEQQQQEQEPSSMDIFGDCSAQALNQMWPNSNSNKNQSKEAVPALTAGYHASLSSILQHPHLTTTSGLTGGPAGAATSLESSQQQPPNMFAAPAVDERTPLVDILKQVQVITGSIDCDPTLDALGAVTSSTTATVLNNNNNNNNNFSLPGMDDILVAPLAEVSNPNLFLMADGNSNNNLQAAQAPAQIQQQQPYVVDPLLQSHLLFGGGAPDHGFATSVVPDGSPDMINTLACDMGDECTDLFLDMFR